MFSYFKTIPFQFYQTAIVGLVKRNTFILGIPVLLLLTASKPLDSIATRTIINNMVLASVKVKTLKFKLKKKERIEDEYFSGEQDVKFNKDPKKIYTKMITPNKGAEVLYIHGKNNNKALINPNSFPYFTLSLDPYGSSMRNNNHHTVHEVGFDYVTSIISSLAQRADKDFDKYFIYKGDTIFNNRPCYKVLIDYVPYGYYNYTVKQGETVTSIAYKLFVSDYMILQLNDIDDYDDVDPGDVIKVPNAYAKRTFLYIDKENFLPLIQMMYDDKGLFAQYEFHNLQLNPVIAPEEFSRDYKLYNFK